ncbi:high-potential iron sulfur protein 2 [Photobacterium carnosum]|uniref:high-potential iron-sulfur protein n=1 Tax=Photobacterium carnosum TaxID=2023717 RepID=UPI001E316152|nr:high-potential iron-sulfur protein [Photobacterium carnosum]MCD9540356.1 high-potential iron sulfur protein 2 [Photobacterium carnosum]
MVKKSSRRRFLQLTAAGLIGLTLDNKYLIRSVSAAELPHLEENNPQASVLKYVNESNIEGQQCKNCLLIRNDTNNSNWQPCAIFPGKIVNINGWCSAYAPKPT